jgi:Z1 domain
LLLIDDEADNASVNTSAPDADPTAINERIRALLRLFRRSTYVGFTATPFANIFIDADSASEMLGDDLFPRDFIYALEPPTNYVGAELIFGPDARDGITERITDAEEIFPSAHKSSHIVEDLPASLLEAINCFLVTNAVRDLRGEQRTHRSMLVNVSRFTNVQHQVNRLVDDHLHLIQRDIQNYSQLPAPEALRNANLKALKDGGALG